MLYITVVCLIFSFIIAFWKTHRIRSIKQFAVGYYKITTVNSLIFAIFASSVGGGSTVALSAKLYLMGGILIFGHYLFQPISWMIMSKIVVTGIEKFKGCISVSEIMYKLYGNYARNVTSIFAIIIGIGVITAQITILAKVLNYLFKIELSHGMLIGSGVLTLYSLLSTFKGLYFLEILKFIIAFLIFPVVYIVTFTEIGGFEIMIENLPPAYYKIELTYDNLIMLLSLMIFSLLPEFTPPFIQRCLMANNAKQLKESLKYIMYIFIPFILSLCAITYITKISANNISPDEVLLYFINYLLPTGFKSIMIVGIVIIITVMAGSWMNSISIIGINDVIKPLYPNISENKQLNFLRTITVIFIFLSTIISFKVKEYTSLLYSITFIWEAIILIPLSVGFLGFKTNSLSFIMSSILTIAFTCISGYVSGEFAVFSLCFGIIGSAIGLFGMHYLQVLKGKIEVEFKETVKFNFSELIKHRAKRIKQILSKPLKAIPQVFKKKSEHIKYHGFCAFTLTYYFIYTLSLTSDPAHKIFAYIISTGYLLCMLLLLKDFVFPKSFQQKYLHLYWYFTVTFCLPLASSFMLFASHGDNFWVINGVLAAISLYLFVDAISFLVLLSIGVVFGYVIFTLAGQKVGNTEDYNALTIGYIYLFLMFISLFFFRRKEKEQEERVQNMHIFGGAMAHEVKSPLATLNMCASTITGQLEKTYNESHDKEHFSIQKEDMEILLQFSKMLEKVSVQGISTVDGLLTSLKSDVIADDKEVYFIKDCVLQAVSEYQALNNNLNKISIKLTNNFKFYGSLHYLKHVLFNLLSNSYKYGGRNIEIDIWTKGNQLYFRDKGKGIAEEDLPYIFDRFYSKNKTGTGIGLAFCKMVMEDIGGNINCKSKLGEYTEFALFFPEISKVHKLY
ncbi:putative periplasmic sensor histidine kinase [endosymbiont of Acanthamoeba sp. UWC8]|uniref:sodium:solute symporter family transporter n=1 Tax=endosymbiont of Acanthamoeba sp. UWC8 TaxID=86106 RepID=UPI0004D10C68|nr:ATP-binding protein [endosymbiont of Acanthamoeba sp. UWC8]AIF81932.1 putative periplasmic sensor histidine kinase [endosymbiont of Acanthamoeba sp. UWC8]